MPSKGQSVANHQKIIDVIEQIQTVCELFKNVNIELSTAEVYAEELNELKKEFKMLHDELLEYNASAAGQHKIELGYSATEIQIAILEGKSVFSRLKAAADKEQRSNASSPASLLQRSSTTGDLQLPKIHIEPFSGSLDQYQGFISLYDGLIHHNKELSKVKKFYYLRSFLSGEAKQSIEKILLDETNYDLAYETFTKTYKSKRRHATHYLANILNFRSTGRTFSFKEFLSVHRNSYLGLENLNLPKVQEFIIFQLAYNNLDIKWRKEFDLKCKTDLPTLSEFFTFIESHVKAEEITNLGVVAKEPTKSSDYFPKKGKSFNTKFPKRSGSEEKCVFCQQAAHQLYHCKEFLNLEPRKRFFFIREAKRCVNCLQQHQIDQCHSNSKCRMCQLRHNTLLHFKDSPHSQLATSQSTQVAHVTQAIPQIFPGTSASCHFTGHPNDLVLSGEILLGTLVGYIIDLSGNPQLVTCLVDPCSQLNLITDECAKRLGLEVSRTHLTEIVGVNSAITKPKGAVECSLHSTYNEFSIRVPSIVVDEVSTPIPDTAVSRYHYHQVKHLPLANRNFVNPKTIDMLLGVDIFNQIFSMEHPNFIRGKPGEPSWLKTEFGWVVQGFCDSRNGASPGPQQVAKTFLTKVSYPEHLPSKTSIGEDIHRLWETTHAPELCIPTEEQKSCEEQFQQTTKRLKDGRFSVSFPFKQENNSLGSNRAAAIGSYRRLEQQLQKDPEAFKLYHEFMGDMMSQQHMEPTSQSSNYILPQHCVYKDSTTTKCRVVFNASSKTIEGTSLNDQMHTGPTLLKDIREILFKFRLNAVTLCADIQQCYRQIFVNPDHRQYQHIFYRQSPTEPLIEYEVNRLLYGTAAAPYLCQRVLQQLCEEEAGEFPIAAEALQSSLYLDDFTGGTADIESAIELRNQVTQLLQKGGFRLRKFSSSHPEVLEGLEQSDLETPLLFDKDNQVVKILGLFYDPQSDAFRYKWLPFQGTITRRSVLSYISRVFDPLHFLAPITFFARSLFQQSFEPGRKEYDWDEPLPQQFQKQWRIFFRSLEAIHDFKIPRWIPSTYCTISFVGFSDASLKGHSAVLYLHCEFSTHAESHFARADHHVASLSKPVTIPKAELCGALVLAQLVEQTKNISNIQFQRVILYSDSQIVLRWLEIPLVNLEIYVANRVCQINSLTSNYTWKYIPSKLNPSDQACRGMLPENFVKNNDLWWHGPEFLHTRVDSWPEFPRSSQESLPGLKAKAVTMATKTSPYLYQKISQFSSFSKCIRVFAYVRRFIEYVKRNKANKGPLSSDELQQSKKTICRLVQEVHYKKDMKTLSSNKQYTGPLASLNPFLDEGVIRVGGRIGNSELSFYARHPIVLPKDCHLSKLIIYYFHYKYLHAGPTFVRAFIRQKFWIVASFSLIKQLLLHCPLCLRFRGKPIQPLMAQLPSSRVIFTRPFQNIGIDYAGPFEVRSSKLRKAPIQKGYICLFICLAVKAVHLEFVSDLTTEAFMAAFSRFVARRGLPQKVFADNGTNFVGTKNKLNQISEFFSKNTDVIFSNLAQQLVEWHFNPPYCPQFGGIWERAVRTTKEFLLKHLYSPLTFEEYITLLCRIEGILNSRPLIPLTEGSDELDFLTPSHFLVGHSPRALIELPIDNNKSLRCRWQRTQQLSQEFWHRFQNEYLNQLMERPKWRSHAKALNLGDLVYVKKLHSSPLNYPLGKINKLIPGKDNVARVAEVTVAGKPITRAVNQLVPLRLV